jgi:DNA-directed RNA polymerase subunit RPC12/RpoP
MTYKVEACLGVTAARTVGLFSASGKTQYFCPKCDSPYVLGPITVMGQKSIACQPCESWFQWRSRIKRSTQTDASAEA